MKEFTTESPEITERLAHATLLGLRSVRPVFSVVSYLEAPDGRYWSLVLSRLVI